jgi:hypothetical protein
LAAIAELLARRAHQITHAGKSCGGVSVRAGHDGSLQDRLNGIADEHANGLLTG